MIQAQQTSTSNLTLPQLFVSFQNSLKPNSALLHQQTKRYYPLLAFVCQILVVPRGEPRITDLHQMRTIASKAQFQQTALSLSLVQTLLSEK